MSPNIWKNEAMWLHGDLDDWYNQNGRIVAKLPKKGRESFNIYIF